MVSLQGHALQVFSANSNIIYSSMQLINIIFTIQKKKEIFLRFAPAPAPVQLSGQSANLWSKCVDFDSAHFQLRHINTHTQIYMWRHSHIHIYIHHETC